MDSLSEALIEAALNREHRLIQLEKTAHALTKIDDVETLREMNVEKRAALPTPPVSYIRKALKILAVATGVSAPAAIVAANAARKKSLTKSQQKKADIIKEAQALGRFLFDRDVRRIQAIDDPDEALKDLHKQASALNSSPRIQQALHREALLLRDIGHGGTDEAEKVACRLATGWEGVKVGSLDIGLFLQALEKTAADSVMQPKQVKTPSVSTAAGSAGVIPGPKPPKSPTPAIKGTGAPKAPGSGKQPPSQTGGRTDPSPMATNQPTTNMSAQQVAKATGSNLTMAVNPPSPPPPGLKIARADLEKAAGLWKSIKTWTKRWGKKHPKARKALHYGIPAVVTGAGLGVGLKAKSMEDRAKQHMEELRRAGLLQDQDEPGSSGGAYGFGGEQPLSE